MNLCSDGHAYDYHKDGPCNPTSQIPAPANWTYRCIVAHLEGRFLDFRHGVRA